MKNFNWEDFKNGKIAVHCDTEEKAKDFLKECEKQEIKWVCGDKATHNTRYKRYKEKMQGLWSSYQNIQSTSKKSILLFFIGLFIL